MPGKDMTGPPAAGGGGRMGGNRQGKGPGGDCVCSGCGTRLPHQAGVPCYSLSCPKCGKKMTRG
jgi:hypothetical protein